MSASPDSLERTNADDDRPSPVDVPFAAAGGADVVLVVDDTEGQRYTVATWLKRAGFRTIEVSTGSEALARVSDGVGLVVLDVHLPDIDGFEVARRLKADPSTAHVPILHLSAVRVAPADRAIGLEGADAYLTHPLEPMELVASARALLRLARTERALRERNAALAVATAQAELSEARLRAIFASAATGIVIADAAGRLVEMNPAFCALLGYSATELRAFDVRTLTHPDDRAATDQLLARLAARESPSLTIEKRYVAKDGTTVWVRSRVALLDDAAGRPLQFVAVVEDVGERRRLDAERAALLVEAKEARAAAEHANRAKTDFLANMSHELRTPLGAIQGHTQLLDMGLHGPVTDAQRDALSRIERAQRYLLGLVNEVLSYARLGSGRVEFDVQPVRIADVVADVLPLVEPQLAEHGLSVEVRLPAGDVESPGGAPARLPTTVWADREKLGQVVLNLLSNAIKFTPTAGRIVVDVTVRDDDSGPPELAYLRVIDPGIGIPPSQLAAIFEPFVQVRSDLPRAQGGTGLGLAISRDLARGMGGDLRARSTLGEGSVFTVTLRRVVSATGETVERRVDTERRSDHERRSGDDRRDDLEC